MSGIRSFNSGAAGWRGILAGLTAREAADLSLDDLGPSHGSMRRASPSSRSLKVAREPRQTSPDLFVGPATTETPATNYRWAA